MVKLSEIIRTDCYIDCGSNEKLREVYPLVGMVEPVFQIDTGVNRWDSIILIGVFGGKSTLPNVMIDTTLPIHHISEIDLNN